MLQRKKIEEIQVLKEPLEFFSLPEESLKNQDFHKVPSSRHEVADVSLIGIN